MLSEEWEREKNSSLNGLKVKTKLDINFNHLYFEKWVDLSILNEVGKLIDVN